MAKLPDGWVFIPKMKDALTVTIEQKELVCCGNCRHWEPEKEYCPYNHIYTVPDWYCADGERRTGDA